MDLALPIPAQYALRAAACLTAAAPGVWIPARDLGQTTHVPPAYLSKVLRRLVQGGILDAMKGHHGGFRLARPPTEIKFADVIRAMDDQPSHRRCQFGFESCNPDDPCPLHPFVQQLSERVLQWAEGLTLADIDCAGHLRNPTGKPVRARAPRFTLRRS